MKQTETIPVAWKYDKATYREMLGGPRKGKKFIELKLIGELPADFKQKGYDGIMQVLCNAGVRAETVLNKQHNTLSRIV